LKLPPTIVALIMNIPPIMVVSFANVLWIQLPKYHDNEDLVLHIRSLVEISQNVTSPFTTTCDL
jgi:hypothetical protein